MVLSLMVLYMFILEACRAALLLTNTEAEGVAVPRMWEHQPCLRRMAGYIPWLSLSLSLSLGFLGLHAICIYQVLLSPPIVLNDCSFSSFQIFEVKLPHCIDLSRYDTSSR